MRKCVTCEIAVFKSNFNKLQSTMKPRQRQLPWGQCWMPLVHSTRSFIFSDFACLLIRSIFIVRPALPPLPPPPLSFDGPNITSSRQMSDGNMCASFDSSPPYTTHSLFFFFIPSFDWSKPLSSSDSIAEFVNNKKMANGYSSERGKRKKTSRKCREVKSGI